LVLVTAQVSSFQVVEIVLEIQVDN
jgi:hypothetical protein